jgi:hypothetical protein
VLGKGTELQEGELALVELDQALQDNREFYFKMTINLKSHHMVYGF